MGPWAKQGIRNREYTCDEYWVVYGSAEPLFCTPETNITCIVTRWNFKTLKNLKRDKFYIINYSYEDEESKFSL